MSTNYAVHVPSVRVLTSQIGHTHAPRGQLGDSAALRVSKKPGCIVILRGKG